MTAIPAARTDIATLIDAAHEARLDSPRAHLGASIIGHECRRWLWYSFRWAVTEQHTGRMKRLFRRGHNEEATIVADLREIGVDVRSAVHIDVGGDVGGTPDGIAGSGVPEAPKSPHILEFKTHSLKSFNDLLKNGVEKSKPLHWAQMQAYMLGAKIERALYVSICKDDDRIYTERVHFDRERAEHLIRRAHSVTLSDEAPIRVDGASSSWHTCKWCPAQNVCHEGEPIKNVNCRTCAHSTANEDGTWHCARWDDVIPTTMAQRIGCESHVLHPDMVPWELVPSASEWEAVYVIDGKWVRNGEPVRGCYSSAELLADPAACARAGNEVNDVREHFNGRIIASDRAEDPAP